MIKRAKLNRCAHCSSQDNLHITFDRDGRMYFICSVHKLILDEMIRAAAKVGVAL
jgi:hypothetical protein